MLFLPGCDERGQVNIFAHFVAVLSLLRKFLRKIERRFVFDNQIAG